MYKEIIAEISICRVLRSRGGVSRGKEHGTGNKACEIQGPIVVKGGSEPIERVTHRSIVRLHSRKPVERT